MKFDIESLIIEKREEREARRRETEDNERARRERRIQQARQDEERYERKVREHAACVSDCFTKDYSPVRLHKWFLHDHWTVQEGLTLLCGFDPTYVPFDEWGNIAIPLPGFASEPSAKMMHIKSKVGRIRRLDNLNLYDELTQDILGIPLVQSIHFDFTSLHSQVLRVWNSGAHTETRYPAKYFIDWAISKKVPIEWLEWAKANNYYDALPPNANEIVSASADDKNVSPKSETAYLNIIGALCEMYWSAAHPDEAYKQTVLLSELEKYKGFHGMGERNLKEKLTKALRAIKS